MNLLQRLTTMKKTEMQAQSEQTAAADLSCAKEAALEMKTQYDQLLADLKRSSISKAASAGSWTWIWRSSSTV
ncbi:hypothetical protein Theco_0525 [Thermobacillus composti KWC4]|uniref:Uncharacterized protein n=1 Tax=Thermobacillus composti (strain DSM 18247 / JCM 13945 / KWC4) TaxID=717605 RepID=L0EAD3_THECK|nr:hypothetical protein [Thermobacillus composti]AGA56737.1 hypothetical protein Theco_0525 [Thermobacillus composti KWC4]